MNGGSGCGGAVHSRPAPAGRAVIATIISRDAGYSRERKAHAKTDLPALWEYVALGLRV